MIPASWLFTPLCSHLPHCTTVGLCDQQNMEEGMGCHFQYYVIKGSMAAIFGVFLPTHSLHFIPVSPPLPPCLPVSFSFSFSFYWVTHSWGSQLPGKWKGILQPSQAFRLQPQPQFDCSLMRITQLSLSQISESQI